MTTTLPASAGADRRGALADQIFQSTIAALEPMHMYGGRSSGGDRLGLHSTLD